MSVYKYDKMRYMTYKDNSTNISESVRDFLSITIKNEAFLSYIRIKCKSTWRSLEKIYSNEDKKN